MQCAYKCRHNSTIALIAGVLLLQMWAVVVVVVIGVSVDVVLFLVVTVASQ